MVFHSQKKGLLDSGSFYAPKTQAADNGDRILWGWIPETRPESEFSKAGWAGCLSLPRVLFLDSNGVLQSRVAAQANQLRAKPFSLPPAATAQADRLNALRQFQIRDQSAEISLRAHQRPFTLKLTDGQTDFLNLSYDPARIGKEVMANTAAAAFEVRSEEAIAISLYLDASVVEIVVNERCALTTRIYQIPAKRLSVVIAEADLPVIDSLQVWQITPISPDRLTT
jgi:beta-fructofuranosidase